MDSSVYKSFILIKTKLMKKYYTSDNPSFIFLFVEIRKH